MFRRRIAFLAFLVYLASVSAWAQPRVVSVVNLASFLAPVCPGGDASIFGVGISPAVTVKGAAPGLTVTINGQAAYIFASANQQVNIQIPFEIQPGNATVVVQYLGQSSAPFAFTVLPFAPGLLVVNSSGSGTGVFLHANGTLVGGAAPALPGETLAASLIGLGQT